MYRAGALARMYRARALRKTRPPRILETLAAGERNPPGRQVQPQCNLIPEDAIPPILETLAAGGRNPPGHVPPGHAIPDVWLETSSQSGG